MEALAVIEIMKRNGETLRREHLLAMPVVIGRGFDADVAFDDPFLAARHLRLDAGQVNGFTLTDLGSLNGFSIPERGNHRQEGTVAIASGETIRLGHTQIRVWRPDSTVAPELLDKNLSDVRSWIAFCFWLLVAPGSMGLLTWVEATGPGRFGAIGLAFLTWVAAVLVWSGLWWLSSRSAHRLTTFTGHGAVGASTLFITVLGLYGLNTLFFAFDFYRPGHAVWSAIVLSGCLALGVYRHLRLVSRKSKQVLLVISIAMAAAITVPLHYTFEQNDLDKNGMLDIPNQLRLPWMQFSRPFSPEDFLN